MTKRDRALLAAVLRKDLMAFTQHCFQTVSPGQTFFPNWHIEAITHHLELCRRRKIRRLIITVPPRNLKSVCASVAFPAFVLGHQPGSRIICASYAQELANKHARDCRAVMESDWYQRVFHTRLDARKNTESEFETTAHGFRLGTSVGGTLTGRGGNLIIIDDPMKPSEAMSQPRREAVKEWYDGTLSSRLDTKTKDAIVLIMQRLHVDDLVGHVLEKGEDWTHLNLPAIAEEAQKVPINDDEVYHRTADELLHPARESQEVLDELKGAMGSQAFSAQYQQAPVPPGGALIKWDWFRTYKTPPARGNHDFVVQSWDTASKASATNDYSVCTTWLVQGHNYYLLDVIRRRLEYPDLKRLILSHKDARKADTVLIEDAGSGTHLIQAFKAENELRPIAIKPEGDKIVRMEAQSATIEAGYVLVPEVASRLGDFQAEIMAFPGGRYDDQIDSVSQFLAWIKTHRDSEVDWRTVIETNLEFQCPSPNSPY